MSPKILLKKNRERENRERGELKKGREEKKQWLYSRFLIYVDFFENCLWGELYFGCNVVQKSSSDMYFSYPCGLQKSEKKGYILKAND